VTGGSGCRRSPQPRTVAAGTCSLNEIDSKLAIAIEGVWAMVRQFSRTSFGILLVGAGLAAVAVAQEDQIVYPANKILAHAIDVETGRAPARPHEAHLSSGVLYPALAAAGVIQRRVELTPAPGTFPSFVQERPTRGCSNVFSNGENQNIRVNQDCSLRRQAEEVIAVNPVDPDNLLAGQNDSRIGFNHCGYDFSNDGGKTWGDLLPPFWQFILKDGHTADFCSDPTVTFDTVGNAYIGGLILDISAAANALIAMKSNAGINGAFYHSPVAGPFQIFNDTPVGVITNDNDPNISNDKPFIMADSHLGSIKKNNVYATWTRFANTGIGVGGDSPIVFSQSVDGGATWSTPLEISGSASFCVTGSGEKNPNACDQDQGSDPVVGPDGTVYVTFGNGNTTGVGTNQILMVSCPKTADCSKKASWAGPFRVQETFDTQPVGPAGGCPTGRQCLPPNSYRLDDFVEISLSVDETSRLFVVFADFRNGKANCTGTSAAPPCDNDVFYTFSTDHGATWSAAKKITPAGSAQWQPWSVVSKDGSKLFAAYYDRQYGLCEVTGCNDITLAEIRNPTSAAPVITHRRVTTDSMPNLTAANNPVEAGFLGDYMWVTLDAQGRPNVVWADTRGLNGTIEEDVYFARVSDTD
jgi:hypothetical protein